MNASPRLSRLKGFRSLLIPLLLGLAALSLLGVSGGMVWNDYRTALMESQTSQMELVVQSLADSIQFSLDEYADRLESAVQKVEQNDAFRPSLARSDTLSDIWLEDRDGRVYYSCHGVTADCDVLLTRTQDISYWQYHSGDTYYLVLKKLAGDHTVCLVVDSSCLYEQLVSDIRVGTNGYVMIKNAANRVVMHPEPAQWGIEVVDGRQKLYSDTELDMSSLTELLNTQLEQPSGIMDYYSYWWTDPDLPRVHKISAFRHLTLGDSFWIVSAVVDYDDLYQPVKDSFAKMASVFSGVAVVLVLFAAMVMQLQQKERRNASEISDLKSLNATLEELHRSEESLAHGQRLQLMGNLTGGIAHEFNNFLTPIMGYADLIMADADPGTEIYDNALEISEAAQKAKDVVRQISAMSRKNVETVYDAVSVEQLVESSCKLAETNCPRTVALHRVLELNGESVLGNATQLQQVLLNVCINGIHAIGQAEGSLTLRARIVPRAELAARAPQEKLSEDWLSYVRIDVSDTGCGMDRETMSRMFEPFYTTKKTGEGTGLGLAMVEQIVRTHRGCLCVESALGKGTTVSIYLPVMEPQRAQEQLRWGVDHKLRILAADDNKKVLDLLKKDFNRLGLSLATCSRRGELRELLASQPFDAVVIDETLTGSSGVEFCMSIRGQYPALTRIVMTSVPTREIVEARRHGVIDGCVTKPVAAATLLEEIRVCRRAKEEE